jgi:hypothetical protein
MMGMLAPISNVSSGGETLPGRLVALLPTLKPNILFGSLVIARTQLLAGFQLLMISRSCLATNQ